MKGKAYRGKISTISNMELGREIKVIGYNHNIQSSYGITKHVMNEINYWIDSELN